MKAMATMKKYKGAILTGIGVLAAIAIVIMSGLIVSCSSQADAGSVEAKDGVISVMEEADSLIDAIDADEGEHSGEDAPGFTVEEAAIDGANELEGSVQPQSEGSKQASSTPAPLTPTGSKSQGASSSSQSPTQKKWVEDTQQVWVEDRAAWTESVPVYGTKEVSICNVCGSDITGNTSAHAKAHMMAGEGSGHHSEVRKVVTGYNTVSHPAEGHYETRVTGGHWE